jgi:transposase
VNRTIKREVRTFKTRTKELLALSEWLAAEGCTHVAMEATGVYWKPVWYILSDGDFELVLAIAAHVKNVPGRQTDVTDATWVADLLAPGLIRGSFVPDPRADLSASPRRKQQTQELRDPGLRRGRQSPSGPWAFATPGRASSATGRYRSPRPKCSANR